MLRRCYELLPLVLLFLKLPVRSESATCPYDLESVYPMIPPACYANATSASASPTDTCCWYVFAAYLLAASRYANQTGAAFLPPADADACTFTYSAALPARGLVRPTLLSSAACDLSNTSLAVSGGGCRYPTVANIRSAVDLSNATLLCAAPTAGDLDPEGNAMACTDCQNAVISATLSLLNVTQTKEFVPCGMAATIGVWSPFFPSLARFRSYALCLVQVLQNIGGLGTSNLIPSPPPPATPTKATDFPALSTSSTSHSKTIKIASASAAAGLISVAAIVFLAFKIRRATVLPSAAEDNIDFIKSKPVFPTPTLPTEGLYIFTKNELKAATNNYDDSLLLGEGGAGKVYLGRLPSGKQVAVKRFYREKKLAEFYAEVAILAKLRHRNLATLIGYCLGESPSGDDHALVYEYMAGGNLESVLFSIDIELPWLRRLLIAADIAEGLAYLHGFPEGAVVHRDVKPTNILLTEDGFAKLSDFGVSRIVPTDVTHLSTELMGTMGYVDPESFAIGHVSESTDAYSFGIVLLELVTGMRAVVPTPTGGAESIVHAARKAAAAAAEAAGIDGEGAALEAVVDPRLAERWDRGTVGLVFELACRCVGPDKNERPQMAEAAAVLRGSLADLKARAAPPSSYYYSSSSSSVRGGASTSERSPPEDSPLCPPTLGRAPSVERWTS